MKKRLKFQRFTKQHVHTDLYWYYAVDYINNCAISVKAPSFGWGKVLEAEISMDCIANAIMENHTDISKKEFVAEYKKALKLLQNVNIVTR
jgi:hypothetical protein